MTPNGWEQVALGTIANVAIGGTPARNNPEYWDDTKSGSNRWVAISDLKARVVSETAEFISNLGVQKSNVKLVPAGTTLMSFKLSIGRTAIAGRDLYTNEAIAAFVPTTQLDSHFLLYALPRAAATGAEADVAVKGKTLNKAKLVELPLLLPPIGEQRKIAAILSAIDDAIEATQAVVDQLQAVKEAMMAELLTHGLPGRHTQFKQAEDGEVPEGWEVVQLGAVSIRITDGSHQAIKTSEDGEIPFLYVSCVRDGEIVWSKAARIPLERYREIARGREPTPGLILYTAVGSFGHAALVTDEQAFAFQRHIACVLPDQNRVSSRYLVQWLNSTSCRTHANRVAVGNAQKTVTLGKLREYPVPLPPIDEQHAIAAALESLDARRSLETATLDELGRVKSALMSVLLTGEVRVTPDEVAA